MFFIYTGIHYVYEPVIDTKVFLTYTQVYTIYTPMSNC